MRWYKFLLDRPDTIFGRAIVEISDLRDCLDFNREAVYA